jgi:hypothetical protein
MTSYLEPALQYHAAGLKVVPFYRKESGAVTFPKWERQREGQTAADIRALFEAPADGIALLCTDGVEAIDIDVKHDPERTIDKQWFEAVKSDPRGKDALEACVIQKTKSGGWHVIYRTGANEGNQKLTHKVGKEAVIETRGKGGLLFIYPTPGYEILRGSLDGLVGLSTEERALFFASARALSIREDVDISAPALNGKAAAPTTPAAGETTPWDEFNASHDVLDVATGYGWNVVKQAGSFVHLSKPGASDPKDIHASIVTTKAGERRFYPFTSATAYNPEKCYTPFAMFAIEEHRGDFKEAAKALRARGLGSPAPAPAKTPQPAPAATNDAPPVPAPDQLAALLARVNATRFDFGAPIIEADPVLHVATAGKAYRVAAFGQMGVFVGHEKSGKSYVLECLAASAIGSRRECLNFSLNLRGRKMIWFDNEQSGYFYGWNQKRVHTLAGLSTNAPNYEAYHLRKFSKQERMAAIRHKIYNTPGLGVVVLDGFVDLVRDYNNLELCQEYVDTLLQWSDELNILLLGVLHINKGDGKVRGHLGSELKNKCDFIVNVAKDENKTYTVSNPTCRYGEWPTFYFTRDEQGFPVYQKPATDVPF